MLAGSAIFSCNEMKKRKDNFFRVLRNVRGLMIKKDESIQEIFEHHNCNNSTGSMVAGSAIFSCNEMKKREDNLPGGLPNNAVLSSILFMALSSVPTIRTSQLQYI